MASAVIVQVDLEPQYDDKNCIETCNPFNTTPDSGCSSRNSLTTGLPSHSEGEFSSTLSLSSSVKKGIDEQLEQNTSTSTTSSAKLKLVRSNSGRIVQCPYTRSAGLLQKDASHLQRSLSLPLLNNFAKCISTTAPPPTEPSLQGPCVLCGEMVSGAHEKLACCRRWICELCQLIYFMDYSENDSDSLKCPSCACDFITSASVTPTGIPLASSPPPVTPTGTPLAPSPPPQIIEAASDEAEIAQAHECIVCYGEMTSRSTWCERPCCAEIVCKCCLVEIIRTNVHSEGQIHIACPNPDCEGLITRKEILALADKSTKEKYECLHANQSVTKNRKTCPSCNEVTEHKLPRRLWKYRERDIHITCKKCSHEWCFSCHAPWHKDLTCREFLKGDKRFKKWTKSDCRGVPNCQKCPLCRVYIQKSQGCNHMTCNRCRTQFCYRCGGFYNMQVPYFGGHHSRTSVLGCTYNYNEHHPFKRRTVRGGYFGAKLAMLTGYPVLFVAGVALLVVGGAIGLPIYGAYKYNKYRKNKKRLQTRSSRRQFN